MRRTLYTLTLMACILCMPLGTFAQRLRVGERSSGMRVTHTYNNVSLSEALLQLNNEQTEYVVNFLYNELENLAPQQGAKEISMWNVYNLLTGANKSSYIDNFLDRSHNASLLADGLNRALYGENEYSWFIQ